MFNQIALYFLFGVNASSAIYKRKMKKQKDIYIYIFIYIYMHSQATQIIFIYFGLFCLLIQLLLTGNLFRQPRPAILAKGTAAILEYLQSRIVF